ADNEVMGASPRVLVVDDDDLAVRLLEFQLQQHGYEVVTTLDSTAAPGIADEVRPDVITLDVLMYPAGGFDVLRRLREQESTASPAGSVGRRSVTPRGRGVRPRSRPRPPRRGGRGAAQLRVRPLGRRSVGGVAGRCSVAGGARVGRVGSGSARRSRSRVATAR